MMREMTKEIDLKEIVLGVLKMWWLIIILPLSLSGLAYYVTEEWMVEEYEATTTLFIGKDSVDTLTEFNINDLAVDSKLVSDYRELIQTKLITEKVIDTLHLDYSRMDIIDRLTVQVLNDSRFMTLSYQDSDPERAMDVANLMSEILTEEAENIVGVSNVKIVDQADLPTEPVSPNLTINVILSAAIGFILAMVVIMFRMLFENTFKGEEDLERILQMPVLGMIPEFEGKVR